MNSGRPVVMARGPGSMDPYHHLAEKDIMKKMLSQWSRFAVEQAMASDQDQLISVMLQQIRSITGAPVAAFMGYNPLDNVLTLQKVDAPEAMLNLIVDKTGWQLHEVEVPVKDIREVPIRRWKSLHDATEGAVPADISRAVFLLTGIDRYITVAHFLHEEFYGTSTIGLRSKQPDPTDEALFFYAAVCATSFHRLEAEKKLLYERTRLKNILAGTPRDLGMECEEWGINRE